MLNSRRRQPQRAFSLRNRHARRRAGLDLESLEDRLLLVASPLTVNLESLAPNSAHDVRLRVASAGGTPQLQVVTSANVLLAQQNLAETSAVVITGGPGNDTLTVDFAQPFSLPIAFDGGGGAGVNGLVIQGGTLTSTQFSTLGPDSGSIELKAGSSTSTIIFSGVTPITDATGGSKVILGTPDADDLTARDTGTGNDNAFVVDRAGSNSVTFSNASAITTLTINTAAGSDSVTVGPLDNRFNGTLAVDTGAGDDEITLGAKSGAGTYTVAGGADADIVRTARDADMSLTNSQLLVGGDVFALSGFEVASLTGGDSANTIDASAFTGSVSLDGGAGNDTLIGDSGNDSLEGGAGNDTLIGGPGDDVYQYRLAPGVDLGSDVLTEQLGGGKDTLDFRASTVAVAVDLSRTNDQLVAQSGGPLLTLRLSGSDTFENVQGGSGNDILLGNTLDNTLDGRGGNDIIDGRAGNDTINGDAGDDTLTGGPGADVISGGTNFDVLVEQRDANMTLTDAALTIGAEVDTLTDIERAELTGGDGSNVIDASAFTHDVILAGQGGSDVLRGGGGNDTLIGGAGDDTLFGGPGNDTYSFNADSTLGADQIFETANGGADLLDFSQTDLAVSIDLGRGDPQTVNSNLALTLNLDNVIENVTGGRGNDTLLGNGLDNIIDGGPGQDTVLGDGGIDTFVFSSDGGTDVTLDAAEALVVKATDGDDQLVLESFPSSTHSMRLRSTNGSMPDQTFAATGALTIDTGAGIDQILVASLSSEFPGPLTISSSGDLRISSTLNSGGRDLGLQAGGSVSLTADVNTGGGALTIEAGKSINSGLDFTTNSPARWLPGHAYKGLSPKSTSGSGAGILVDVEVDTFGVVTASIVDPGVGYRAGDTVSFGDPQPGIKGDDLVLFLLTLRPVTISTRDTSPTTGASVGDSGDVHFHADHILLAPNSKLLADTLGSGSFAAGDIKLEVDEIAGFDLQGFANVDASMVAITLAGAEVRGGNVDFSALANNTRIFFDQDTLSNPEFAVETAASVLEGLADIIGGVSISTASAVITIDETSSVVATSLDANVAALTNASSAPIGLAIGVAIGIADSTAEVIVAGDITTTGDTILQARTDNTLDVRGDASAIVEFAVGMAVSVLNSTAMVDVKQTSALTVGGDLQIQADDIDRNYTAARSNSGRDGSIGAAVAVSVENGSTVALLDGTAVVGGDIVVNALQEKGQILGSKLGIVPVHYNGVHAAAGVNTNATGDLLDDAQSAALGKILVGPLKSNVINPIVDKLKLVLAGDVSLPDPSEVDTSESAPFDVGAGIAVVVDTNTVEAHIGDGANRVKLTGDNAVSADGSISVHARTDNVPDVTAKSLIQDPPTVSAPRESTPTKTKFGGSVAIAFGDYRDTARAYINKGAVVNARGSLTVRSETLNDVVGGLSDTFAQTPSPTFQSTDGTRVLHIGDIVEVEDGHTAGGVTGSWYRYRGINGASVNLGNENYADLNRWDVLGFAPVVAAKTVVGDLTNVLANSFGVDKLFNTWSQATATSNKIALAGAVTVLNLDHDSEAFIAEAAEVNQDASYRSNARLQRVTVEATNTNQAIHFGGNVALPGLNLDGANTSLDFTKPGAGSRAGDGTVGASFLVLTSDNRTTAEIDEGARVFADSLKVDASNDVISAALSASGGSADKAGFAGSLTFDQIDNHTLARIGGGATVTVGSALVPGGNGASLVVVARDRTIVINAVGGVGLGSNVGVGASIGINVVNRDTQAVIGNRSDVPTDATSFTGSLNVAGAARVEAVNSGFIGTFALAAAVARDSRTDPLGNATNVTEIVGDDFVESGGSARTGVGVAGDAAVNVVNETTHAVVSDARNVSAQGLQVLATSDTTIALLAGAASVSLSGSSANVGLAGSFSSNAVVSDTKALITDSNFNHVGDLTVDATQSDTVLSVTASSSGAPRTKGVSVAGSVSVNVVLDETEASITNSTLNIGGDARVTAHDESVIWSGAGALALGGSAGVGAALSLNLIGTSNVGLVPDRPGRTRAFIDGSTLTMTGGTLDVSATVADPDLGLRIISASGSAGASIGGQGNIGGAGTISLNVIKTTTEAFITNAIITTPRSVVVNASESSGIVAVSGAVGVSQKASFGAAFGDNQIASTARAFLDNVDLTTTGALTVTAHSSSIIGGATVGVAAGTGSSKLAVAGSASVNKITNTIDAHVADTVTAADAVGGSTIQTGDDLRVAASDDSRIVAITGGASVAAKGVAVGAAVGYNLIQNRVSAYIEDATADALGATSSVEVSAASNATLASVALGVGVAAGAFSLGGSVAVNSIADTLDAHIANTPHLSAGGDVSVTAHASDALISVAGGFAAANDVAVGAAIAYTFVGGSFNVANPNVIDRDSTTTNQIAAFISNAVVSAGHDIVVDAGYDPASGSAPKSFDVFGAAVTLPDAVNSRIVTVTVGGAAADAFALGGSVSVQFVAHDINAYIAGTRPVRASGDVVVSAADDLDLLALAGGVAGGKAAVGAVVSTLITRNDVEASIVAGAGVRATGNVLVLADRDTHLVPTAGALGGASQVGIGGAVVTLVQHDSTVASIGNDATVVALAAGSSDAFPDGTRSADGRRQTRSAQGVLVAATTFTDITGISVAGGVAGTVGLAGSALATDMTSTTSATIGDRAKINQPAPDLPPSLLETQSVRVFAADDTRIVSSAGTLAGSGTVSVGVATDVELINKTTRAAIGANALVNADDDVSVEAFSSEDFVSVTGSVAGAGKVAVAGSLALYMLTLSTVAEIGDGATALAEGNVVVSADDQTSLVQAAGGVSGALVGAGATAATTVVDKQTLARIGQFARVDGLALRGDVQVPTGVLIESFAARDSNDPVSVPAISQPEANDPSLKDVRSASAPRAAFKGVAVFATAFDRHTLVGVSAGGGAVDVRGVGVVATVTSTTKATVGDGADINQNRGRAGVGQSVTIAALADFQHLGVGGTLSGGGAAVTPGAEVLVLEMNTDAETGSSSDVSASRDVSVFATAHEDLASITTTAAGGGAAVAGAGTTIAVNNTTRAGLGVASVVTAGNVVAQATDESDIDVVAGSAAVGLGSAGIGGSVTILDIQKNTTALVGDSANVVATGNSPTQVDSLSNDIAADSAGNPVVASQKVSGLVVQAMSHESILAIAASGSGGAFGGLAGAVTFANVDADTFATIGAGTQINQGATGGQDQSVHVVALDRVQMLSIAGALTVGSIGGLAGGVDVGQVHNDTAARIGDGAAVKARRDIDVVALSGTHIQSFAASGAAGAVGLAGAMSVYSIGGNLSADGLGSLNATNGATTSGYIDARSSSAPMLGNFGDATDDPDRPGNATLTGAKARLQGDLPHSIGSGSLAPVATPSGTSATVGSNAILDAGGDINVAADGVIRDKQVAGAGQAGLVGFGGSVVVLDLNAPVTASVQQGTLLSAADTITVSTSADKGVDGEAYVGSIGGIVGLGAQVVLISDSSTLSAGLGAGVNVLSAGRLDVSSASNSTTTAKAAGGTAGGVTAGASIARITANGSTLASIGDGSVLGQASSQGQPATLGSLSLTASEKRNDAATAVAVTAAVAGGAGADARVTAVPVVSATLGDSTRINTNDFVNVIAKGSLRGDAESFGLTFGGLTVGLSFARSEVSPRLTAEVGRGAVMEAGGNVAVRTEYNQAADVITTLTQGEGAFAMAVAGSGAIGAGAGATANVIHRPELRAEISDNATIHAGGNLDVSTLARTKAVANGLGGGFGVVGVGSVSANVDDLPLVFVNLHAGTGLRADGDIHFAALLNGQALANATAAGGGIVAGAGATAVSTSAPFVHVNRLGTSNVLDPGSAFFFAGGNADVIAQANGVVTASSNGTSVGGITVGVSDAQAAWAPTSDVTLISNTSLVAGLIGPGDVRVLSLVNRGLDGSPFAGGPLATATASAGTVLLGNAGATAAATATPKTTVGFGPGVIVRSSILQPGDVTVLAASEGQTQSRADASAFGALFARGAASSTATANPSTGIAAGTSVNLTASGILTVQATDQNSASATSTNSGAGFAGIAASTADAIVTRQTNVTIRDNSQFSGGAGVSIGATSRNQVTSRADADGRGFGAGAAASASAVLARPGTTLAALDVNPALANSSGAATTVEIGPNVSVTGSQVTLASQDDGSTASALGNSFTGGAITNSDANTRAYRLTSADVIVRQGAGLQAPQGPVRLDATTFTPHAISRAVATAQQAAGDSDATAINVLVAGSLVTAEPGSSIVAGTLDVIGTTTGKNADPAAEFDTQARHQGTGADFGTTTLAPRSSVSNGAAFDANVKLTAVGTPAPELIIAADGTITKQNGISGLDPLNNGTIIVRGDFPAATPPARFVINTPSVAGLNATAVLRGRPTIDSTGFFFDQARVVNDSSRTLILGDIVIPRTFGLNSVVSLPSVPGASFAPTLVNGPPATGTKLTIDNRGGSEIRLQGNVDNTAGSIEISSPGGVIRQFGGTLRARTVTVNAGSVGFSDGRLSVNLTPQALASGQLLGSSSGDAFFVVKTTSASADNPQASLQFSSGGLLDISFADGTRVANGAAAVAPTNVSVLAVSAAQGLTLSGGQVNFSLADVSVPAGIASIATSAGVIKGLSTATALRGAAADLRAGAGLGPITTQVVGLEASGGSGGITIRNQGDLRIGSVSALNGLIAAGVVDVSAVGLLRVGEPVQGSTVSLAALDLATAGQNLQVLALVKATAGAVTFNAGDDLFLLPLVGTAVASATTGIFINVDSPALGNADPGVGSTVQIGATLDSPSLAINGGPDNDVLRLTRAWTALSNRPASFNGQGGVDTLVGPDVTTTWSVSSVNGGGMASTFSTTQIPGMAFTNVENLTGGAGNDSFFFVNGGRITGQVNGGGGFNFMGYSQYTQGVVVDLSKRQATGIDNGFLAINSVTGSPYADLLIGGAGDDFLDGLGGDDILVGNGGNDILVGGDGDDKLYAGAGRDILLGGRGNDKLFGGTQGDILVAGLTVYDANPALDTRTDRVGLERVRDLWLEQQASYAGRLSSLVRSSLLRKQSLLPDSTEGDVLAGGPGRDWLIGRDARRLGVSAGEAVGFPVLGNRLPARRVRPVAVPHPTSPLHFGRAAGRASLDGVHRQASKGVVPAALLDRAPTSAFTPARQARVVGRSHAAAPVASPITDAALVRVLNDLYHRRPQ